MPLSARARPFGTRLYRRKGGDGAAKRRFRPPGDDPSRKQAGCQGASPETPDAVPDRRKLRGTNIELPAYVWDQVRTYLDEHPEQRVRHMVMAGFQALGLQIDPEDLVAERRRGPGG